MVINIEASTAIKPIDITAFLISMLGDCTVNSSVSTSATSSESSSGEIVWLILA
ncbi:MAG: hypothetical protein FWE58_06455 [Methanobrevibacter sp.]|nr:hypothetical protein [Methanobrevibacter sp.]